MSHYLVDRCVCHSVPFAQMLPVIQQLKESEKNEDQIVCSLRKQYLCTSGCGLCEPYIRLMIRSEQTAFRPIPQQ